ncbi:hypothetical protein FNF29_04189 [Cafeteria roenbergensis]|uniref:Uncharacterized protein n=1 Tax=Cafeteria roenbergensis TaxID=33653 RepID=A0A5A8CGB7_CAFRO|nr:hypothetical protein FNF29_04189 [Cafeteria roenbergensis]|eukprot:KAA0152075.1 hypothetical protein FNF29_04189 [Cafeteria roenbergensis]
MDTEAALSGAFAACLFHLNAPEGLPLDPWSDNYGILPQHALAEVAVATARAACAGRLFEATEPKTVHSSSFGVEPETLRKLLQLILSQPTKPDGSPASSVAVVPGGRGAPDTAYRHAIALCGGSSLAAVTSVLAAFSPIRLGDVLSLRCGIDPTLPAVHASATDASSNEASKSFRRTCRKLRIVCSRSKLRTPAEWTQDAANVQKLVELAAARNPAPTPAAAAAPAPRADASAHPSGSFRSSTAASRTQSGRGSTSTGKLSQQSGSTFFGPGHTDSELEADHALRQATAAVLGQGVRRVLSAASPHSLLLPVRDDVETAMSASQMAAANGAGGAAGRRQDGTAASHLPAVTASTVAERDRLQAVRGDGASSGRLAMWTDSAAFSGSESLSDDEASPTIPRRGLQSPTSPSSLEDGTTAFIRGGVEFPSAGKPPSIRTGVAMVAVHGAAGPVMSVRSPQAQQRRLIAMSGASLLSGMDDAMAEGNGATMTSPKATGKGEGGLASELERDSAGPGGPGEGPVDAGASAAGGSSMGRGAASGRHASSLFEAEEEIDRSVSASGAGRESGLAALGLDPTSPATRPDGDASRGSAPFAVSGLRSGAGAAGIGGQRPKALGAAGGRLTSDDASTSSTTAGPGERTRHGRRWLWPRRDRVTALQVLRFWTPVMRRSTQLACLGACLRVITCLPGTATESLALPLCIPAAGPPPCDRLGATEPSPRHWVRVASAHGIPPSLRDIRRHTQPAVAGARGGAGAGPAAGSLAPTGGATLQEVLVLAGASAASAACAIRDEPLSRVAAGPSDRQSVGSNSYGASAARTAGMPPSTPQERGSAVDSLRSPATSVVSLTREISAGAGAGADAGGSSSGGSTHAAGASGGAWLSSQARVAAPSRGAGRMLVSPDDLRALVEALLQRHPDLRPVAADRMRRSRYVTFVVVSLSAALRAFASQGVSGREITRSNIADALVMCARGSMHGIAPFGPAPAMAAHQLFSFAATLPHHAKWAPGAGWITVRQLLQASGFPPRVSGPGSDGILYSEAVDGDDPEAWALQPSAQQLAESLGVGWPEVPMPRVQVTRELVFAFARGQSVRRPAAMGVYGSAVPANPRGSAGAARALSVPASVHGRGGGDSAAGRRGAAAGAGAASAAGSASQNTESLLCFEDVCWLLQAQEDACSDTSVDFWLRLLSRSGDGLVSARDIGAAARAVVFHARDVEAAELFSAGGAGGPLEGGALAAKSRKEGLLGTAVPVGSSPAMPMRQMKNGGAGLGAALAAEAEGKHKKRRRRRSSLLRHRGPGLSRVKLLEEEGVAAAAATHQVVDIIRPRRFIAPERGCAPDASFDAQDVKRSLCGAALFELLFKVQ